LKPFFVYLLRCADATYYCGHTDDLELRMQQHATGRIGHTAVRKPVTLVWQGGFEKREEALAFERQIKGWSRAKKEALIAGNWPEISRLARSRQLGGEGTSPGQSALRQAQSERCGERGGGVGTVALADQTLIDGVLAGQRRALAKAITLIESTRGDHQLRAQQVLNALLPHSGQAIRVGISGVPGVGKSSFIEALGTWLIDRGHRLAVLAVDPSSTVSGGSILGDKTRMETLCQREEAFIRPSPSAGSLGGVAEKTREAMLLCEAAGFDVIIVETVGVGQSETTVAGMVDIFCLLQLPNAGDDLQAIKKGIVEIADLVVINKADIDPRATAVARAQWKNALHWLRPASPLWHPPVLATSALKREGLTEFWQAVEDYRAVLTPGGEFAAKRQRQARAWMDQLIDSGLRQYFRYHPGVRETLPELIQAVEDGRTTPTAAARALLGRLRDK